MIWYLLQHQREISVLGLCVFKQAVSHYNVIIILTAQQNLPDFLQNLINLHRVTKATRYENNPQGCMYQLKVDENISIGATDVKRCICIESYRHAYR